MQEGDPMAAVGALRDAAALAPQESEIWNDLGLAWQAAGGADSARASFEHAIHLAPGKPEAHLNLAVLSMRQGAAAGPAPSSRRRSLRRRAIHCCIGTSPPQ
jgi:Flp pilus assembly protein TadD